MICLLSSSTFSFPKEQGRRNEDCVLPPLKLKYGYLMAIADGVGSYAGASSASTTAIEYLASLDSEAFEDSGAVETIFEDIKARVSSLTIRDPSYFNAATTLTFCYAGPGGLTIGHIGDCRAYLKVGGKLSQVTKDHTQHQMLIDEGLYKASELKSAGGKNTLFSAISKKTELRFQEIFLRYDQICDSEGDVNLIMMSDGAYHSWEHRPRFLESTLQEPSRFSANLKRRIMRAGATDDCSLVAVRFAAMPQLNLFD